MNYQEKLIEFLAQAENISFLLDIVPLIPKVKDYKYKKCYEEFANKYIYPKVWSGYSTIPDDDDNILFINDSYQGNDYFHIHVNVGQNGKTNWYGILGNENIFNLPSPELQDLRRILEEEKVIKEDRHYVAYKYLPRNREELLRLPFDKSMEDFFDYWADIFWAFAENVKNAIEVANGAIQSKNVK